MQIFDQPSTCYLEYSIQCGAKILTGNFLHLNALGEVISDRDVVYHLVSANGGGTAGSPLLGSRSVRHLSPN